MNAWKYQPQKLASRCERNQQNPVMTSSIHYDRLKQLELTIWHVGSSVTNIFYESPRTGGQIMTLNAFSAFTTCYDVWRGNVWKHAWNKIVLFFFFQDMKQHCALQAATLGYVIGTGLTWFLPLLRTKIEPFSEVNTEDASQCKLNSSTTADVWRMMGAQWQRWALVVIHINMSWMEAMNDNLHKCLLTLAFMKIAMIVKLEDIY